LQAVRRAARPARDEHTFIVERHAPLMSKRSATLRA
jgi:hypothetical protein